jgi:hypothetical protein
MTHKTPKLHDAPEMKNALEVLSENADKLFADAQKSNALRTLIAEALQTPLTPAGSAATAEAAPAAADLEELAKLVHAVVQIEDSIAEVQSAATTVLDWISKGGRSLGID